jgi:hypothetical protein
MVGDGWGSLSEVGRDLTVGCARQATTTDFGPRRFCSAIDFTGPKKLRGATNPTALVSLATVSHRQAVIGLSQWDDHLQHFFCRHGHAGAEREPGVRGHRSKHQSVFDTIPKEVQA